VAEVKCIDCIAEGVTRPREIKHGGPRSPLCVTHHRARRKRRREAAHGRRLVKVYEMSPKRYWALYAYQGGKCAGCGVATGKAKNLAVDHDHELAKQHGHPVDQGCPLCWRGLLCGPCNQLLGRLDVDALIRLINYLYDPPARRLFALTSEEEPLCPEPED